jgi:hypothetical protein
MVQPWSISPNTCWLRDHDAHHGSQIVGGPVAEHERFRRPDASAEGNKPVKISMVDPDGGRHGKSVGFPAEGFFRAAVLYGQPTILKLFKQRQNQPPSHAIQGTDRA